MNFSLSKIAFIGLLLLSAFSCRSGKIVTRTEQPVRADIVLDYGNVRLLFNSDELYRKKAEKNYDDSLCNNYLKDILLHKKSTDDRVMIQCSEHAEILEGDTLDPYYVSEIFYPAIRRGQVTCLDSLDSASLSLRRKVEYVYCPGSNVKAGKHIVLFEPVSGKRVMSHVKWIKCISCF